MGVKNRLASEKSPYLLQHASNPVHWYPWGLEAFAKARIENKPVFLSIGYATCHWCHVMEHESFEDERVALILNADFVSIKVDREERPDIDSIYMTVCQGMTGAGGWPLTILMTADKKPFFAGTYFPKEERYGRIGLIELLQKISAAWKESPNDLITRAEQITKELRTVAHTPSGEAVTPAILDKAFTQLQARFDPVHGGFGGAPKFPTMHHLLFLLRTWRRTNNPEALSMVEKTVQAIRHGGIYDQVGFGIHRYSTDAEWAVPHFEKMLYDQAMLLMTVAELFQETKNQSYAAIGKEILTYLTRDMSSPEGAFYSAEDADSEGIEGKFYEFTEAEIRQHSREELFVLREKRVRPLRDDKI
ncbi:MAG: thioredoxin domain-containing protein, partial [bacterium]|nr:thioredoxin domain-containing protein [bacterium]